ncbi:MAG: pilus assembly protein TadG-related protein [Planctomycetota bacterium]|jgi:Flp pilus assembly protein TadG
MLRQNHHPRPKSARRGVAVVFAIVVITLLVRSAALTFDVGAMYHAKANLQDAADAAAMAAAGAMLSDSESSLEAAAAVANCFSGDNCVFGRDLTITPDNVTFGIARLDEVTRTFSFEPNPTGTAMEEPFGPSWGWMYAWGGDVNVSGYDPAADPGLVYWSSS